MSDIRYICLSDTHFGEEDSLLTNLKTASTDTDPSSPSPVAFHLAECLKHLISKNENSDSKPTLILNGDILEMALCETNEAAMAFERFLELVMPPGGELFDKIFYLPGNHDHHLWESARETQYVNYIETTEPEPLHGAAVVLLDGNLNVASLRMYNEDSDPAKYAVRVEEATHAGEEANLFCQRIKSLVNPADDPWRTFSSALARAVRVRAQNLRARINERN